MNHVNFQGAVSFTPRRSLVALQLLRQDPRGRKVARSAAEKIQVVWGESTVSTQGDGTFYFEHLPTFL